MMTDLESFTTAALIVELACAAYNRGYDIASHLENDADHGKLVQAELVSRGLPVNFYGSVVNE